MNRNYSQQLGVIEAMLSRYQTKYITDLETITAPELRVDYMVLQFQKEVEDFETFIRNDVYNMIDSLDIDLHDRFEFEDSVENLVRKYEKIILADYVSVFKTTLKSHS